MQYLFVVLISLLFISCGSNESDSHMENETEEIYKPLPYLGFHDTDVIIENGVEKVDTIYHEVPAFALINQDCTLITNEVVQGKIYVTNFFFTSCPAICPAMMEQMKRLQGMTRDIEELVILSHSIDPERDSIPKLRQYIEDREIDTGNWHLLRGEREYVHTLGQDGYMLNVLEDEEAEGGFLHAEYFALVDREGHIRGLYNGTKIEEVDQLNDDIRKLLKYEYHQDN